MLMYSSFHILDDNFNEFVIIYSLYFVFHYLYRGRLLLFFFFKDLYWIYKFKDRMRKINNSVKIPMNKSNIIILHS